VDVILQAPRAILPLVGASLLVFDEPSRRYEQVGSWGMDAVPLPRVLPCAVSSYCSIHMSAQMPEAQVLVPCCCLEHHPEAPQLSSHCLPFARAGVQIGLLNLYFRTQNPPDPDCDRLLAELGPDLALVIERFQLRRLINRHSADSAAERKRIARHLHDTLADDLAYIRLKLDQLASCAEPNPGEFLPDELQRLAETADQSYNQVRSLLADLQDGKSQSLTKAFQECAVIIGQRANFEVEYIRKGDPKELAPHLNRQILYILREGLRNIEKHAHAHQVSITETWGREDVTFEIADNGRGFDPELAADLTSNYGLRIIKECTEELSGRLTLASRPQAGTRLSFWFPVSDSPG
jgi:two-component system nitrate/nitrite sensor histidine kinase NarX